MTAVVSSSESAIAPQSMTLWLCSCSTDPRCERMLKEWKISAMDMVRNAIVMPSGLLTNAHWPDSI